MENLKKRFMDDYIFVSFPRQRRGAAGLCQGRSQTGAAPALAECPVPTLWWDKIGICWEKGAVPELSHSRRCSHDLPCPGARVGPSFLVSKPQAKRTEQSPSSAPSHCSCRSLVPRGPDPSANSRHCPLLLPPTPPSTPMPTAHPGCSASTPTPGRSSSPADLGRRCHPSLPAAVGALAGKGTTSLPSGAATAQARLAARLSRGPSRLLRACGFPEDVALSLQGDALSRASGDAATLLALSAALEL